ncbi:MAG: hypothetical protein ACYDCK_13485 [Thermoplasmatota archaeon]
MDSAPRRGTTPANLRAALILASLRVVAVLGLLYGAFLSLIFASLRCFDACPTGPALVAADAQLALTACAALASGGAAFALRRSRLLATALFVAAGIAFFAAPFVANANRVAFFPAALAMALAAVIAYGTRRFTR